MKKTLARFNEQFNWEFEVQNPRGDSFDKFLIAGMGGSHLGAWLIKSYGPARDMIIHRGYGLPRLPAGALDHRLFIASSYSGTTEEIVDSLSLASNLGMKTAALAKGGTLIEKAEEMEIPYVQFPDTGLEPRMAIGYSMLALARLMGDQWLETAIRSGGNAVKPLMDEKMGVELAERIRGRIPLVWSSQENMSLAFMWKIKFNETSKIPAFCNSLPELCHNELTGLDVVDSTRALSAPLAIIMLEDESDHPRVQKRMQIAREMLRERKIEVERVMLTGSSFEKAFRSALLADWVSLALADYYGVPNPETPLIAEFKKRMA